MLQILYDLCSAGCRPDEEALLSNVEVDVAADLVGHVCAEIATHDAMPHGLVFLLKRHLHIRCNQLYIKRGELIIHCYRSGGWGARMYNYLF